MHCNSTILKANNVSISFFTEKKKNTVAKNINFSLFKNEILGIVGESGSGKSITCLAILGLLPKNAIVEGEILFEEKNILQFSNQQFKNIRGNKIAMVFQEPMSCLNPSLTCGFQVLEILLEHTNLSKKKAKKEVISLFKKVKLPRAEVIFKQYPHQLSGGQKQRVMIAMAIACKPDILIADEPTTALDVTVQKEIISLLKELQEETKMGIIFISHDLALVSEIAQKVLVMYKGKIVEKGKTKTIFTNPKHAYTKALIIAKPNINKRLKQLPTIANFINKTVNTKVITKEERAKQQAKIYEKPPLLEVKNIAVYFGKEKKLFAKNNLVKAVNGVTLNVFEGETLGLVGESGCGKTTLGRAILHLEKINKGSIYYQQKDVTTLNKKELKKFRKEVQIIFQDPFSSLNPRITVGKAIVEPMKVHQILNSFEERKNYVISVLKKVGLQENHFYRYPHEFSGGQRQRIGIARTIVLQPKLIICDESVSALDVSVQAQVLNLLNKLKEDFGFTYIFISHDLAVVKYMSNQLAVMNKGKIEEIADADEVYENPKTSYTKKLISAVFKGI